MDKEENKDSQILLHNQSRKAIFVSLEGGIDGNESLLSHHAIVELFFRPKLDDLKKGHEYSAREQREILLNSVRSIKFQKGNARRLFSSLCEVLNHVIENDLFVPASAYEKENDGPKSPNNQSEHIENQKSRNLSINTEERDKQPDEASTEALLFLKACGYLILAYLENIINKNSSKKRKSQVPSDFHVVEEACNVAQKLHNILFALQSCGIEGQKVQNLLLSMCEKWWLGKFIDREFMVPQFLPVTIMKALDSDAKQTEIKRLFSVRDALYLLDFEDENISFLRSLLLKTVSNPLLLRSSDGRRIISMLFQLDKSLISDLHQSIRVQIPDSKKPILLSYGDIYYRAWTESNDEMKQAIEECALQDLMYAALHIESSSMAKSIMIVLSTIHEKKKSPNIDKLLYRMYGPIMWRALSASNALVRVRAASILAETFPLHDPDRGSAEMEGSVKKTVATLTELLMDPDPRVRVAAADATARILATFWDALPPAKIQILLDHLITKHSSDTTSSAVRAQAVTAISMLLDAPQSHAVLRPLLPYLGNLIHDRVERVRLAAVRMLLKVKTIRGIKYYHVVPVDHILKRLAAEGSQNHITNLKSPVASTITKLILNSYFPQGENVSSTDQMKRTLSFLTTYPDAAFVFYSYIARHLSINSVSKLIVMLLRCLTTAVKAEEKKLQEGKHEKDKSSMISESSSGRHSNIMITDLETVLIGSNTTLMANICETMFLLLESISTDLNKSENVVCDKFIREAFSGSVVSNVIFHFDKQYEKHRKNNVAKASEYARIISATLRCAGMFTPKMIDGMATYLSTTLENIGKMNPVEADKINLAPHIALYCAWGMHEDIASTLASSIKFPNINDLIVEIDVQKDHLPKSLTGKKRKNDVNIDSTMIPHVPAKVALKSLDDILCGDDQCFAFARTSILSSSTACSCIQKSLETGTKFASKILSQEYSADELHTSGLIELVLKSCESYGRLCLHRSALENGPLRFNAESKNLFDWISSQVVPVFKSKLEGDEFCSALGDLNLSVISDEVTNQPFSPIPNSTLNRRSSTSLPSYQRNSLENDASFALMEEKGNQFGCEDSPTTFLYAHILGISLIKSTLYLFAEWVSVGVSDCKEQITEICRWCEVLNCKFTSISTKSELLSAFCRTALIIGKRFNNFDLLMVIANLTDDIDFDCERGQLLQKTISSIFSWQNSDLSNYIESFIIAFNNTLDIFRSLQPADQDVDISTEVNLLIPKNKTGLIIIFDQILNDASHSLALARILMAKLNDCNKTLSDEENLFDTRLLVGICKQYPRGKFSKEFAQVMRALLSGRGSENEIVKNFIEKAIELEAIS